MILAVRWGMGMDYTNVAERLEMRLVVEVRLRTLFLAFDIPSGLNIDPCSERLSGMLGRGDGHD